MEHRLSPTHDFLHDDELLDGKDKKKMLFRFLFWRKGWLRNREENGFLAGWLSAQECECVWMKVGVRRSASVDLWRSVDLHLWVVLLCGRGNYLLESNASKWMCWVHQSTVDQSTPLHIFKVCIHQVQSNERWVTMHVIVSFIMGRPTPLCSPFCLVPKMRVSGGHSMFGACITCFGWW